MKSYKLVPITQIRCVLCKHFRRVENSPYDSAIPIIAICEAHQEELKAYEWYEFARDCKEYEPT